MYDVVEKVARHLDDLVGSIEKKLAAVDFDAVNTEPLVTWAVVTSCALLFIGVWVMWYRQKQRSLRRGSRGDGQHRSLGQNPPIYPVNTTPRFNFISYTRCKFIRSTHRKGAPS